MITITGLANDMITDRDAVQSVTDRVSHYLITDVDVVQGRFNYLKWKTGSGLAAPELSAQRDSVGRREVAATSSIEINGGNGVFIMDGSVEEPAKSSRQKGRVCWPLSNLWCSSDSILKLFRKIMALHSCPYRLVNFEWLAKIIIKYLVKH